MSKHSQDTTKTYLRLKYGSVLSFYKYCLREIDDVSTAKEVLNELEYEVFVEKIMVFARYKKQMNPVK